VVWASAYEMDASSAQIATKKAVDRRKHERSMMSSLSLCFVPCTTRASRA